MAVSAFAQQTASIQCADVQERSTDAQAAVPHEGNGTGLTCLAGLTALTGRNKPGDMQASVAGQAAGSRGLTVQTGR